MPQLVPFSKSDLVNFLACLHLVLLFIIVVDGDDSDEKNDRPGDDGTLRSV